MGITDVLHGVTCMVLFVNGCAFAFVTYQIVKWWATRYQFRYKIAMSIHKAFRSKTEEEQLTFETEACEVTGVDTSEFSVGNTIRENKNVENLDNKEK